MGFWDKFFKKKSEEIEKIDIPESWDFYICSIEDRPASYYLNLALRQVAPIADKNKILWIEVKLNQPTEDGMSSPEEYDGLIELEDRLIPQVEQALHAIYVGRLTHNGLREFYFYVNENQYSESNIQKIIQQEENYQINFGAKVDPEWSIYCDSIYPNAFAMQSIANIHILESLEQYGDVLTVKRPVEHWCYFKTSEDRDHFLQKIQERGFEIVEQSKNDENENPYSIQIGRIDSVDLPSINQVTWELLELCIENNGEYDGWETPVIRN
ncbi:DUF695 domain-containing protein [Acinetobacter sp. ANC 4945]|uniref:DUF695 domain-containing protein n=1 Tax=Acinetobacter amyesii TaxID=2942470 RepID=A0A1T1H186_9GAMM|nr:DUF695 domain-containing protein [Acinetobacter amyesii]MCL6248867.1 DUF695 domain-containing protein [Acinetobacter amyesii]OOV83593.1 hypothetical protein B1202_08145 [Acinetobacter amyesii]